jgi:hypothetical protein
VTEWVVFLHVAVAFGFVSGLVGRNVTLAKARASADISAVRELVELAGRFERRLVIPGSFAVLVAGFLAAFVEDRPLAGPGNGWLLASLIIFVTMIPLVPLVFLPRGRVFERALVEAADRGEVTPSLTKAFRDPAVAAARAYEMAGIAVIVLLMVVKPF